MGRWMFSANSAGIFLLGTCLYTSKFCFSDGQHLSRRYTWSSITEDNSAKFKIICEDVFKKCWLKTAWIIRTESLDGGRSLEGFNNLMSVKNPGSFQVFILPCFLWQIFVLMPFTSWSQNSCHSSMYPAPRGSNSYPFVKTGNNLPSFRSYWSQL